MMWHNVSDKAPPKEGSPWVVFLCPQWVSLVRYDAVKRGWCDRKGDYMFTDQCHPEVFWTLAPGQQTGSPDGETVEVRFAVVVDDNGCWYGVGWDGASDSEVRGTALDCSECNESETLSFVTARIPLPKPLEIRGEVEP